jgi:hypothetical protein
MGAPRLLTERARRAGIGLALAVSALATVATSPPRYGVRGSQSGPRLTLASGDPIVRYRIRFNPNAAAGPVRVQYVNLAFTATASDLPQSATATLYLTASFDGSPWVPDSGYFNPVGRVFRADGEVLEETLTVTDDYEAGGDLLVVIDRGGFGSLAIDWTVEAHAITSSEPTADAAIDLEITQEAP